MKKQYTKPELFCEKYELCTAIAAACATPLGADARNSTDPTSCNVIVDGMIAFVDNAGGCELTIPDGWGGMCYQVPQPNESLFAS